jgi:hypothetical protein
VSKILRRNKCSKWINGRTRRHGRRGPAIHVFSVR